METNNTPKIQETAEVVEENKEVSETAKAQEESTELKKKKFDLKASIKHFFNPQGIQLEMLRYRVNKPSYNFGLLAVVFLVLGFCIFYSGTNVSKPSDNFFLLGSKNVGPWVGVDILINIVTMLFLFSMSIEMNNYSIRAGWFTVGISIFNILKIFLLPLSLKNADIMTGKVFTFLMVSYIISGACGIIAGLLAVYRGTALRKFLATQKPIENEKVGK